MQTSSGETKLSIEKSNPRNKDVLLQPKAPFCENEHNDIRLKPAIPSIIIKMKTNKRKETIVTTKSLELEDVEGALQRKYLTPTRIPDTATTASAILTSQPAKLFDVHHSVN